MSANTGRNALKAINVGTPQKHPFPEVTLEMLRTGGQRFKVYLNNDVSGFIITGVEFIIEIIGPQDVYAKRYSADVQDTYPGYHSDPEFETPVPGDCPGAITRGTLRFREITPSGGGIGARDQTSGTSGYCYISHALYLSKALY